MKRREFLKRAIAGSSLVAVPVAGKPLIDELHKHKNKDIVEALKGPKKFGFLDVETHTAHRRRTGETLHVFVDGRDVTWNCYEADDVTGYALVRCRDAEHHRELDAQGHLHIDKGSGGVCTFVLRGDVVIKPGPRGEH